MTTFKYINDHTADKEYYLTSLLGKQLLNHALLNKGTAFTLDERKTLSLLGKLPPVVETLEEQIERAYSQFKRYTVKLSQYIYLTRLREINETLFYALVQTHLLEMMPILYTPIVGDAVQKFSHEFRTPRGLYLSAAQPESLKDILTHKSFPDIQLIVVTDGEGVLGIGDQGLCAIDIPVAKLMVYTLFAGIHPSHTLPIVLDVGTNNESLLNNPFYLGAKQPRLTGKKYMHFIDQFVSEVRSAFPNAFIHWEDFGAKNASHILKTYQQHCCTFNDDIQGTAVVACAAIIAGIRFLDQTWKDQRVIIFGAGTAGCGIAQLLAHIMQQSGLNKKEISERILLIDKTGLLTEGASDVTQEQAEFLYPASFTKTWTRDKLGHIHLREVVQQVKPTVLIGCSAVAGAFTQPIIQCMSEQIHRPIILPLSNPTERAEAKPSDLLTWSNAQALIATGSPYDACHVDGQLQAIPQCNNALAFPGIGLGVITIKAKRLTQGMLCAAAQALADHAPILKDNQYNSILPYFSEAHTVTTDIALSVAAQWIHEHEHEHEEQEINLNELRQIILKNRWNPMRYIPIRCNGA